MDIPGTCHPVDGLPSRPKLEIAHIDVIVRLVKK